VKRRGDAGEMESEARRGAVDGLSFRKRTGEHQDERGNGKKRKASKTEEEIDDQQRMAASREGTEVVGRQR